MKVGLQVPSFTWSGGPARLAPVLQRIGQTAEEAGFASLWVMDHFFQIQGVGQVDEPMLESYSALSYIAGDTRSPRHDGHRCGLPPPRYPGQDCYHAGRPLRRPGISRYRCSLERTRSVGWACLSRRSRSVSSAWKRHCRSPTRCGQVRPQPIMANTSSSKRRCVPPPAPHKAAPAYFDRGEVGEKKTLRLVAQYADACNLFALWRSRRNSPQAGRCSSAPLRESRPPVRRHRTDCDWYGRYRPWQNEPAGGHRPLPQHERGRHPAFDFILGWSARDHAHR